MNEHNIGTLPSKLPDPQAVAHPGMLVVPYPLGIDGDRRDDSNANVRPVAAWFCDELYEGRNYTGRPVDRARD